MNLPEKLMPIVSEFNKYRYTLIDGGRGGGKTQAIARLILYLADIYKMRVVCGREVQNTIEESVYTVFRDLIFESKLDFKVLKTRIDANKTGTQIMFKGFREQGAVSIKGLEGVDILWIDESQSIKKNTLDIIIPTIRKEDAKVFFTMNRWLKNDPVYKEFIGRDDCLHIHINYDENKYCTDALKHEAEVCRTNNPDDYGHIWLGQPMEEADNYLFSEVKCDACRSIDFLGCGYHEVVMGVDVARYGGDKCQALILQRRGPMKYHVKHREAWGKKSLMESTGRIIDLQSRFKPDTTVIDGDGMGAGIVDRMGELQNKVIEFRAGKSDKQIRPDNFENMRTECYYDLEELVAQERIEINDDALIDSLLSIMYTHKSNGIRMLLTKEQMRSKGFKSPDEADALMMALYGFRFVDKKIEQEENFRTPFAKNNRQSGNLFHIAGYK